MRLFYVLTACAFLAGCDNASDSPNVVDPMSRPDVLEAIFRHQFSNNASGGQGQVAAFCLEVGQRLVPSSLVAKFADVMPSVRADSDCEFRETQWVEKATGDPALVFHVDEMKCSLEFCEATGGYREGNLSASQNMYKLEKRNGTWVVTGDKMQWIS